MSSVFLAAVCIGGAILVLVTLGGVIIGIIRAAKAGGISKKDQAAHTDETKMIQDIFNSLSKMEERIDTLETILIERGHRNR